MRNAAFLFLLALPGQIVGGLLSTETLYPTQENFDLDRFLGTWYDVAMVSNCPMHLKHQRVRSTGTLELQPGDTSNTLHMTRTAYRQGICKNFSTVYELTKTPGRMTHHSTQWGVDVDSYVLHTNYNEYAIVVMSTEREGGNRSATIKLYGRSLEVRPSLMTEFKQLANEQGMSKDSIVVFRKLEKCVPGEKEPEPEIEMQRRRRNVVVPTPAPEEGSGDDTPLFRTADSCQMSPDVGPCFGMFQRFYFNSTLMACQAFAFGGCLGNQNNFVTERECLQSCRTEAACRMPMDPGPCKAYTELWAFNSAIGKCVSFKYGGCQGNGNKFYTQKECEEYCGVIKEGDEELLKII
ncbi:protein AMBP [Megalops cyprinoides]|uniref:protein AMBP n=1 Tax=Megalops cyprinoides TaxID=118141 RepID=UPI001864B947|nr:protein AMBP [Megalops cyprinoides]